MLFPLLALFIAVPLLELFLLFRIAGIIGWWETFGLVIVTGFIGAGLARAEGMRTMQDIQRRLGEGRLPGDALIQGAMILVAGALLVTPGVITDAVGFFLLIPPTRRAAAGRVMAWLRRHVTVTSVSTPSGPTSGEDSNPPRRHVASRVRRVEREE